MANSGGEQDGGGPPFFKTWGGMYLLVLGSLVAAMVLFGVLTRVYDR